MKLSEAILKGCESTLPARCTFGRNLSGEPVCCALGAAYVGLNGIPVYPPGLDEVIVDLDYELGLSLNSQPIEHPLREGEEFLSDVIISLNDAFDWSRERIAAYLAENGL